MLRKTHFCAAVLTTSLMTASPVFSDAQTTEILEEYLELFKSAPVTINVGAKDDGSRFSQWNDIVIKSVDDTMVVNIPWIKVDKKLLGGLELTFAEEISGAFEGIDTDDAKPIKFVMLNDGMTVGVDGDAGARSYASTFKEMTFKSVDSEEVNFIAKMMNGSSTQLMQKGDIQKTMGDFSFESMILNYDLKVDDQIMKSESEFSGLSGKFDLPIYGKFDLENPTSNFDPSRDLLIEYSVGSGTSKTNIENGYGPIEALVSYGEGSGKIAITDSVVELIGDTKDMSYDISAAAMGLPPVQLNAASADVKMAIPLDNIEESKQADYKIGLSGLTVSDQVWNIFDPQAILPRDAIELDIDLSADLRWLKKLAEIDVNDQNQSMPLAVDSAKINALNLKVAGAELQTEGSVLLDNKQFPPVPDGTVNVSLKGAQGLLEKLTQAGLLPAQNALAIRGMSAVFFEDRGEDNLVSTITMGKDGSITANGFPLQ